MKLSEHIDMYYGGNVAKFCRSMGIKNHQQIHNLLARGGYAVNRTEIYKTYMKLPQSAIDHVKKIRGEL